MSFALVASLASPLQSFAQPRSWRGGAGEGGGARSRASADRDPDTAPIRGPGANVAIQPIDGQGQNTEVLRELVARIVRERGFRPVTSLPRYEGTAQYPVLAKDYRLAALVTADLEDLGRRQRITFLVWSGHNGSVVGRWTAAASTPVLRQVVHNGFWSHLGPALRRARGPRLTPYFSPAPPVRIDASNPEDRARYAERR